ncbi:class I SAM-dependent methyltransferase [Roseovarius spongiae]|uniref:Class I SAM-dependent methyltransferase n=1 Tax=Roseovarius spongiae TaxID=2320272 RepID=A0A3A8B786_9RHOB|nr:class I SAM-dependent methyltransferase [Roseovarius spongiae]RKF12381.1 class I SAM-dependent methyltransferase [Roseovarius spongiae]
MKFKEWVSQKRSIFLTGAGLQKSGFFTKYKHVASVPANLPDYAEVEALFESKVENFSNILSEFSCHIGDLKEEIGDGAIPFEEEGMFPPVDVVVAYYMIRKHQPQRVLEIGSGASSYVIARALKKNKSGTLTCIDPVPRRSIAETGANFIPRVLNYGDIDIINKFSRNDILFVDSSHIMLPGMDVDIQFNRMFPRLPCGAIVHVHDIFLPENYPLEWGHRNYSEQNALIGWIISGFFEVLFPSFYVATRMRDELQRQLGELMPEKPERNAGSIWLRRSNMVP